MPEPTTTPFTLRIEEALTGRALPILAVVLLAGVGALYAAGVLAEGTVAAAIAVCIAGAGAVYLAREALAPRVDAVAQKLLWIAAAGVVAFTAWPAVRTVAPGKPEVSAELQAGDALPVPTGGVVRVLVQTQLPPSGSPVVSFRLTGGAPPVEGKLERTWSYARVGRGGRSPVAHDRNATFFETKLPRGGAALRLESFRGETVGPLHVAVFPEPIPTWLLAVLAVAVAALAAVADARVGKGNAAVVAGMALAFGLLVAENATPSSALGTTFGSILLGAIAGALGGAVLAFLAKRVVPAAAPAGRPPRG